MSLTNSSSTVKFSWLTAFTAAQNNITAVEVHAYDLRDSSTSIPITDTRLGNPPYQKRWRLYILPQYLANQTKLTGHIERYGLTAVVPILTALLLWSLSDLQVFFVLLYALLAFSGAKHYR